MNIRNPRQVHRLLSYALRQRASRNVLDALVSAIVTDFDDQDVDIEFETDELSERIDFLVHVLGPDEADEAVRAAIDGKLVLHDSPGDA